MSDVSLALQAAIIAALKNASAITAIVGARVYDNVPIGASFPYVTYGEDQVIEDDADAGECQIEGMEVFTSVHAWSRALGRVEVKRLGGAIREAIHNTALSVTGFRVHLIEHESTRYLRDPDGITSHGVVLFRALLDPV